MGTRVYQLAGGAPATLGNQHWPQSSEPTTYEALYLQQPAQPDPFDDEFNDGSPDLAERGWLFRNASTGQVMQRVGDVYPYEWSLKGGVGVLAPNQYRSRIQNGRFALQLSASVSNDYVLYKPVSLPTTSPTHGGIIWGRFGSTRALDVAGAHGFQNVAFFGNSAGLPDLANRNYHEIHYDGPSSLLSYVGVSANVQTSTTLTLGDTTPDDTFGIMTVTDAAAFGSKYFRVDTQSGADSSSPWKTGGAYKSAAQIAYAGMGFYTEVALPERTAAGIRYIDFVRLRRGDVREICSSSLWLFPES